MAQQIIICQSCPPSSASPGVATSIFRVRVVTPAVTPAGNANGQLTSPTYSISYSVEKQITLVDGANNPLPPPNKAPQVMYQGSTDRLYVVWASGYAVWVITLDNTLAQTSLQKINGQPLSLSAVICNNCPTIASATDGSIPTVPMLQTSLTRPPGSPPAPSSASPDPASPDWYSFKIPVTLPGSLPFPGTSQRNISFAYASNLDAIHLVHTTVSDQQSQLAISSMSTNDFKTIQTNPSLMWSIKALGGLTPDDMPVSAIAPMIVTGLQPTTFATLYGFFRSASAPINTSLFLPSQQISSPALQYFTLPLQTGSRLGALSMKTDVTSQPPIQWTYTMQTLKSVTSSGDPAAVNLAVPSSASPSASVNMAYVFFPCTFVAPGGDDGSGVWHVGLQWAAAAVPDSGQAISEWQLSDYIIPASSPQDYMQRSDPGDFSCTIAVLPSGWLDLDDDTANGFPFPASA